MIHYRAVTSNIQSAISMTTEAVRPELALQGRVEYKRCLYSVINLCIV